MVSGLNQVGFNDVLQAGAQHLVFSTNHLTDTNKTEYDYNQNKQTRNLLLIYEETRANETSLF